MPSKLQINNIHHVKRTPKDVKTFAADDKQCGIFYLSNWLLEILTKNKVELENQIILFGGHLQLARLLKKKKEDRIYSNMPLVYAILCCATYIGVFPK